MADYDEPELAMEACDEDVIITDDSLGNKTSGEESESMKEDYNNQGSSNDPELHQEQSSSSLQENDVEGAASSPVSENDVEGAASSPVSENGATGSDASEDSQQYLNSADKNHVEEDSSAENGDMVESSMVDNSENSEESNESNEPNLDLNSALPESERAIEVDRTESENCAQIQSLQESAGDDEVVHDSDSKASPLGVQLTISKEEVPSETVEADLTLSKPDSHLDRTPKESSASERDHDNEVNAQVQESNQSVALDNQDSSIKLNQNSTDDKGTTNMHDLPNSSQEMAADKSSSLPGNPSKLNYSTSQNGASGFQARTASIVDSDDDTLLSELDDLLHKSMSGENTSLGDLPNGLRRDALECGDSKKLLVEMDVLKRKCGEQELEIKRIQEDCVHKEARINQLMQSSQVSVPRVAREHEAANKAQVLRIKELEVVVEQYHQDFQLAKDRQISHDKAAKKAISQIQQEMILRIDQVKKLYEEAVKDKETMVIRYAKSEKEVQEQKKAREMIEHRLRETTQQAETLHLQIKQLRKELSKLKSSTEVKDNESSSRQKEMDQLKEEISSQAIKVKWAQNKLKTELDAHKETKGKLTETERKLKEAKEETEQIRKNCQGMIKTYQESEEIKSNSLDQKLKEKEVEFAQHLQEKNDQMELHNARLRELETLKKRYHDNMAELDSLQVKTKCLEDERLQNEELLSKFKELLNSQKDENRRLTKQVDDLKALQNKLHHAKEEVKKMETNMSGQKEEYSELETELQSSRIKQTELLQFTEKITAKNTQLSSDNSALSEKVDMLTSSLKKIKGQLEELKGEHSQVSTELKQEKQYRERESAMLTAKLTEKAKAVEQLSIQLEDARDEMKTLKRKNVANVKDLTRQLQQAQKRLDLESKDGSPKDNLSLGSRTSSSGSLDTLPNANSSSSSHGMSHSNSSSHINSAVNNSRFEDHHPPQDQHSVAIASNDYPGIDKTMLVERIVKLQRAQQRKNEKIEFMQEHVNSLVDEIKKKSKIIHQYILREEAGALTPAASDANKAQMSKQTGIMSSLYTSKATDRTMTLDLSLEINRKLQAVLEDTLLKNITLKENIETLGTEIAHLTRKMGAIQNKEQRPKRK